MKTLVSLLLLLAVVQHPAHARVARRYSVHSHTTAQVLTLISRRFRSLIATKGKVDAPDALRLLGRPDREDLGPPIGDAGGTVNTWHYRCQDGSVYLDANCRYGYSLSGQITDWGRE